MGVSMKFKRRSNAIRAISPTFSSSGDKSAQEGLPSPSKARIYGGRNSDFVTVGVIVFPINMDRVSLAVTAPAA
jgi:hypothetical protein